MLYRGGFFAGKLPFSELKAQAYINPVANMASDAPDFSQRIRKNRAGFEFLRSGDIASPSAVEHWNFLGTRKRYSVHLARRSSRCTGRRTGGVTGFE